MSTIYEPGTVAVATVDGEPNVRIAFIDGEDTDAPWVSLTGRRPGDWVRADRVTDVRPLVVLDPDMIDTPAEIREHLSIVKHLSEPGWLSRLAEQIEAQTKPPKPAEPTGLGAVVEAEDGRKYVRTANTDYPWVDAANPGENAYHWTEWGGLPTPPVRVISEGVES